MVNSALRPVRASLGLGALAVCLGCLPSAAQWADRAEYDLALALRQQSDPATQLQIIHEWRQKYPFSAYRAQRAELQIAAALAAGDPEALETAVADLSAAAPESLSSAYWVTILAPSAKDQSEAALLRYEEAAQRLLEAIQTGTVRSAAREGQQEAERVESLAWRTLGWVHWKRQQRQEARKFLLKSLELDPARADVSAWLGVLASGDPAPEAQVEAIFRLARAAYLDGPGALPSAQRRDVRTLLESVYTFYHGSLDGLDAVAASARANLHPPRDFRIESAAEVFEQQWERQMLAERPDLAPFFELRRSLSRADEEEIAARLKDAPEIRLRATVLGCADSGQHAGVHVALTDRQSFEAVLKPDVPLPRCPKVGSQLEFTARVTGFEKEARRFIFAVSRKTLRTLAAAAESDRP